MKKYWKKSGFFGKFRCPKTPQKQYFGSNLTSFLNRECFFDPPGSIPGSRAPRNTQFIKNLSFSSSFYVFFDFVSIRRRRRPRPPPRPPPTSRISRKTFSGILPPKNGHYKIKKRIFSSKICNFFTNIPPSPSLFTIFLPHIAHSYIKPIQRTSWYHASL